MNFDIAYELMLPALTFFAKATSSYGWSIILLTLLVRVLVWPLVAKSTKSMQRMAKLQPQLKALQDRYKNDPELFQKKAMEFYSKNRVNPMSGCLPILIQLPILFALYATFSGPPFADKAVDVKVNVSEKKADQAVKPAPASTNSSPYLSDGYRAKVVVFPGESNVVVGDKIDFGVRASQGKLPDDFAPTWKVIGPGARNPRGPAASPNEAVIDSGGHATFLKTGEYHVLAIIPGVAKNESFYFVHGLGHVASGLELLRPEHWDALLLIVLFGATMYLSQKFTVSTPTPAANQELDEQQIIQQQTMKVMPVVTTGMFLFIPLPAGVFLYLVLSNVVQTLQTWLIMRMPAAELVSVTGDEGGSSAEVVASGPSGGNPRPQNKPNKMKNPTNKIGTTGGANKSTKKKKQKPKKS